jgi:drug/metabolite transporter (DMT)-like permease
MSAAGGSSGAGPTPARINLLIGLLCLIWGSTWIAIKAGLDDLPPFTSAAARLVISAVVMAFLASALAAREGGARPPFWLSALLGLTNFAGSYGIIYWCETRLPSGLTSILWAIFPLVLAIAAHFVLPAERLRARQFLGFVVGFGGVVVLHRTDVRELGPEALLAAQVLILSPVVSAIGNLAVKRYGTPYSSLLLNRDAMAVASVALVSAAVLTERGAPVVISSGAIFSLLYLSLVGTVVTFSLYFWLLRYATATKLSLIAYVTPLIALGFGVTLGGEHAGADTLLGAALILGGVALAARPRFRAKLAANPTRAHELPAQAVPLEDGGAPRAT